MLNERLHPAGWLTLTSPKLEAVGVPHGFTTAVGPGDARWRVKSADDLAGVLAEQGLAGRGVLMGRQAHGVSVTTAVHREQNGCDDADAHVTFDRSELVAVRTADCVPILLSTGDGRAVAAVHAGWRGLEVGIIRAACDVLADNGVNVKESCVAAIGPCIGVAAYEVGEEVAAHFEHGVVRRADWAKPHLDLRALALRQLLESGLAADRIDVATACTFDDAHRFGSYRRDGRGCGHQAGYIGPVGS